MYNIKKKVTTFNNLDSCLVGYGENYKMHDLEQSSMEKSGVNHGN